MKHTVAASVLALVASLALVAPSSADEAVTATSDGRLVLLLDASGSMKETSAGSTTKIEAAKAALGDVVERLPDDAQVGVRVFGATVENRGDAGACTDTQNVVPVGPLDKQAVIDAVDEYKPYGETPIGNALKGAAQDLGSTGKRTIVLLSDGEPTCDPDPCKVAKELRKSGIDLTVNVVGLNVGGKARSALQCIADAGGGTYYGVDQPDELASSLVTVAVRALREFQITGDPVSGGATPETALELEPGQYADTVPGGESDRYYTIDKPEGGSVSVAAIARPSYRAIDVDTLEVELTTPDGQACDRDSHLRQNVLQMRDVMTAGTVFMPQQPGLSSEECAAATQLVARVGTDFEKSEPIGLVVRSAGAVENYAALPEAVTDDELRALAESPFSEPSGEPSPVAGGTSFADAPSLAPGLHVDSVRPGEQLLYKIPAGWGQRVRVRATIDADAMAADQLGASGLVVESTMFTALLHHLDRTGSKGGGLYNGDEPMTMTVEPAPLRVRNVESTTSAIRRQSLAGDQYLSVTMGGSLGTDANRFAPRITIAVVVDGEETDAPAYAGTKEPAPVEAEADAKKETDEGATPWLPIGLGALAVLIGVGAIVAVRRRSTRA